jgi:hypothetical protein
MDHDAFVDAVMQAAGIDHDEAERAVRATLTALAERISAGEARDLAAQLPPELAPWLNVDKRSERFDVDEFLRRVAVRSGADGTPRCGARGASSPCSGRRSHRASSTTSSPSCRRTTACCCRAGRIRT